MRRIRFDAIVFHTSFLSSLRWGPQVDETLRARALELRRRTRHPRGDAAGRVPALGSAVATSSATLASTSCSRSRRRPSGRRSTRASTASACASSPRSPATSTSGRSTRIDEILRETPERPTDVFYRAGAERPYLGRHGMLKTGIATAGEAEARARGLTTDVSLDPGATLLGDDWFRALAASRWTLGVEGGASILDPDGEIRAATMRYVAEHPDATYDEIEAACFPGRDGELALFAISPRHLEACATRTGQILVEGGYSGVLEPGRHYLPVRADLSDLGAVLEQAKDETHGAAS